jgi:hypothetical protein
MSDINDKSHGNEGPEHTHVPKLDKPSWKQAHLDWRFQIALVLMFAAIAIYVLSDDLAFLPRGGPRPAVSGAVGK